MTYFKTLLLGSLTAIMILTNGRLAQSLGNTGASVLIHVIGLIGCCLWLLLSGALKSTLGFTSLSQLKKAKGFNLSGGVIGYLTVWLTNASFSGLGVAATLGLAIGGQAISALVVDHFGLFGSPRRALHLTDLSALILTLAGAALLAYTP